MTLERQRASGPATAAKRKGNGSSKLAEPAERDLMLLMQPGDVPDLLTLLPPRPAWMADASCKEPQPGASFFPARGESLEPARAMCARCPVRVECLNYALADPELTGIWGGTTEKERRQLRQGSGYQGEAYSTPRPERSMHWPMRA